MAALLLRSKQIICAELNSFEDLKVPISLLNSGRKIFTVFTKILARRLDNLLNLIHKEQVRFVKSKQISLAALIGEKFCYERS